MAPPSRGAPEDGEPPPHSVDAERGVLSSMMQSPGTVIPIVQQALTADFFFVPAHRTIFLGLCDLFLRKGNFDLLILTQYFTDVGQVDSLGGPAYLTRVYDFVLSSVNVAYYIEILQDKRALRAIIRAGAEAVRRAYELSVDPTNDPRNIFEELQANLDLAKSLLSGTRRLPKLHDLSTLIGENRPPSPPEIVKGLLHRGSKLIVGGTSKGRKTFSLIDLAVSVAAGVQWWGFDTVQGPVCYINFEIQESFFCERTEDICRVKHVELPANMLMGWNLRGYGDGIEKLMPDLLAVLRQQNFVLIIVDPIYKALGNRDENKAGDVASMLNELERIAVRTGSAVAFGAHYSKGNQAAKESIDRIGGSGVFARDPDSILTMTAHQEPDAFTVEATLRNFKPIKPFVVRWNWPLFTRDDSLDPDALKKPKNKGGRPADAIENAEEMLELLNDRELRYGDFKRAAENQLNIKEKTFEKYFSILKRNKRIIKIVEKWRRNE